MNSPFPKQISPCPIAAATIEVRFSSDLKETETLDFFYKIFSNILPDITGANLPPLPEFRLLDPRFKYIPEYHLSSTEYSVGIGRNIISFNFKNQYPLWGNYFDFIKTCLKKIENTNRIRKIERIGLRYLNVFQGESKISAFSDSKLNLPYNKHGYALQSENFTAQLKKDEITIRLHIAENAQIKVNNITVTGVLFDIDASQVTNLSQSFNDNIVNIIDSLHTEEKNIFFLSLNEEYARQHFEIL